MLQAKKKKLQVYWAIQVKYFDYELLSKNLSSRPKIQFLHGNIDEIIPVEEMYEAVDFLKINKFNVDYKVYENLSHAI